MTRARDAADQINILNSSAADATAITIDASENVNFSANATFGDNDKAIFGAGSDLQIYHDGSDSIIKDAGTGHLRLLAEDFRLQDASASETYITAAKDGAVALRFNDSPKLATTSTGVDVTGTLTSDGLTVDYNTSLYTVDKTFSSYSSTNGVYLNGNAGGWISLSGDGSQRSHIRIHGQTSTTGEIMAFNTGGSERMRIDASGFTSFGSFSSSGGSIGVQELASGTTNVMRRSSTNVTALNYHLNFHNPNGSVGTIGTQGSSTIYATSSDYRLKTDAQPMTGASARVQALNPVNFEWIADGSRVDGFLAHEAQAIVPESVSGAKDAMRDEEYEVTPAVSEDVVIPAVLDDEGNELEAERTEQRLVTEAVMGTRSVPDYQGIDQSKLVPLLTAALQEALTEITDLKARVVALEAM